MPDQNAGESDPRLAFVYDEALRGLTQQQTLVENMNARAGSVIFATAFASSLLGAQALSDGVNTWDWIAVALLLAIGVTVAVLLWPWQNYRFRFDPNELLAEYVERDIPLGEMHRQLAIRIESDRRDNWQIIQRLRVALQLALALLVLDILAWLLAIANA